MDYSSWSRCEAVPLSNGIITRRTGLHYMKSPEEINAYYQDHFGSFWFDELPKTDNTYCPTSKYYGCTLAPGIPLIPNLCRRPLRTSNSGEYEYSFKSFTNSFTDEARSNVHNSWMEKNNVINTNLDNGNNTNHIGFIKLPKRKIDFQDSGLDSDSDFDESQYHYSQNTVTWLSWIITAVTTIVTVITESVVGRQHHENHINTRVPLKQNGGVSWYQYPVLWLYKLALLVHRADVWLLYKINSFLRVDSWGTPQQRRKWALILLLIPLIIWAGLKVYEWLMDEGTSSDSEPLYAWLLSPLITAWDYLYFYTSAAWNWFDGSWLWAPWMAIVGWLKDLQSDHVPAEDVFIDESPSEEWNYMWLFDSVGAFFVSLGGLVTSALSSLGEGAGTVFSSITDILLTLFSWIVDLFSSVPALFSSALAYIVYPFKSISWESAPVDVIPPTVVVSAPYSASSNLPDSSLETALRDKQLLALLVRNVLSSKEFNHAMAEQQTMNKEQVNSAVDYAFNDALSKINLEFTTVKEKLHDKLLAEDDSVETKVNALKHQIQELQMALMAHKALVSEQASLGSRLEARITTTEQLQQQQDNERARLMEQILTEVAKVKSELSGQLMSMHSNKKVVLEKGDDPPIPITSELEAYINSTVEKLLAIYDADKIAKVDYALASSGGSVLNVRCSETFSKKNAQYYLWGYPVWSKASINPRIVLEPGITAGECWAFTGSRGYLVIELSENITVTGFTLEHLPRSLCPSGAIDTAPKDFRVLGLESEQDDTPILLGRFKYEDNGVSLQHFQALEVDHGFKIVELVVESNHGNLEYTCLYRFRVHGRPVRLS